VLVVFVFVHYRLSLVFPELPFVAFLQVALLQSSTTPLNELLLLLLLLLLFCIVITGNNSCDVEIQVIQSRYFLARDGNRLHIVQNESLAILGLVHKHKIILLNVISLQKLCRRSA